MKLFTALTLTLALLTEARSVDDQVTEIQRDPIREVEKARGPRSRSVLGEDPESDRGGADAALQREPTFPIRIAVEALPLAVGVGCDNPHSLLLDGRSARIDEASAQVGRLRQDYRLLAKHGSRSGGSLG